MHIVALELERKTGELNRLASLASEFDWLSIEAASACATPLVTTGINMLSGYEHWRPLIYARMKAGLGTIVIPGFKPGDYSSVTGAPTALEAVSTHAQSIVWENIHFRVPASVAFRTKLHASKWAAIEGVGALLLSYRPTNARGCVVFCGASVGSCRPGTDSDDQTRLLQHLLDLAATTRLEIEDQLASVPADSTPLSATEFLSAFPEIAPHALLLLLAGWNPQHREKLPELGRSFFGFEPDAHFQAAALRVRSTPAEIESTLNRAGWSPFVRKLQERLHEPQEEFHA